MGFRSTWSCNTTHWIQIITVIQIIKMPMPGPYLTSPSPFSFWQRTWVFRWIKLLSPKCVSQNDHHRIIWSVTPQRFDRFLMWPENIKAVFFIVVCMAFPWIWLLGCKEVHSKLLHLSNCFSRLSLNLIHIRCPRAHGCFWCHCRGDCQSHTR